MWTLSFRQTENISEPLEWDLSRGAIRLGLNYVGFYDEIALFNRALTEDEIQALHQLETGTAALHP
ncbi:LamG domain-containing protein [Acidobacteria bacterium AH-259-O06]|nr:LamG domain-containing protein [Acidobacteria bacterium AH-259-O06]